MLSGTADLDLLAAVAPEMPSIEEGPVRLPGCEILQATFEMAFASRESTLPSGLHPTTPPLMLVLAWACPDSPWGPFTMAQVRVSCRSGVRPRGFVAGCLVDAAAAAHELSTRWGLPARVGQVSLTRFYDSVLLNVAVDGVAALGLTGIDPDPLGPGDVQYTVTTTLAHTPRGLRLVQMEPEYEVTRAERIHPRLDCFDPPSWSALDLTPRRAVVASIAVGDIDIPRLRFLSRPDVSAFEGTESI
jgi:hypothetical protein